MLPTWSQRKWLQTTASIVSSSTPPDLRISATSCVIRSPETPFVVIALRTDGGKFHQSLRAPRVEEDALVQPRVLDVERVPMNRTDQSKYV